MTTTMKHKRSSVAGNAPDAADIETGELAINFPDAALYTKDGSGNIIELSITDAIKEPVKNVSGGSLSVGTVVYQSGTAGNSAEVQAASNSSASTMPALGILTSTLADEAEGYIVLIGKINHINTSSFNEGDTLYVGASGTLTTTVPSGEGALIQNIGKVLKVHASNGSIMVTGAGRTNATPNLNDGNIFIGNSSNQATTASFNTTVDAHLNTSTANANETLRWNGSDYEWADSAGLMTTYNFTATNNQTTFSGSDDNSATLGYAAGSLIVTVNGIVYEDGTDYTATNGTSVVFTSGLETDDEVNVVSFTVRDLTSINYSDINNTPTIPTALTDLSITDGTDGQVLTTDGSGTFTFEDSSGGVTSVDGNTGAVTTLQLGTTSTTALAGDTSIPSALTDLSISDGTNGQVLTTDGSGTFTFSDAPSGDLVDDTTPQLGGDLDTNGSDITFGDNDKAIFGAGSDLRIYHDGFHSYIYDVGAGDLRIRGTNLQLQSDAGENYLSASNNGAVTLYHDNAAKLATTSTGIDVTGTVTADELSVDGNIAVTGTISINNLTIDQSTTSTSHSNQTSIKNISATDFRSVRYTVQVTNITDSTYHLTEILVIHDGTTPSITEYGTIFTGAAPEATFDADIASGQLRLLVTPASADNMSFKVVAHAITS